MVEEEHRTDTDGASLPFSPTIATNQYLLLTKMNNISKSVWFISSMIAVLLMTNLILFIALPFIDITFIYLITFTIVSSVLAFVFFFIISYYFPIAIKIRRSMIPQWALLFFELWPKQEGCNDRQDLYLRLRYIFGLSVPSMDAQQDNTKFDFKLYESVFNNKIFYRQKKEYILDIGDTLYNSTAFVIYFVVILIVCALFYFLVELVIDWYSISDIFIKIFLYSLISVNIIAYLIIIYFSYYSMEIIAAKFFKPDVKIEQLREYRDALKQSIGKRQVINFAGIVIDGDIDRSLLEWVQSEESRISDEVKMTLIQKKPIGFKLIWMG